MLKNKFGITLIALVITIIILLILAGVTIVALIGNGGLLEKSKTSVDTYNQTQVKEELEIKLYDIKMKAYEDMIDINVKLCDNLKDVEGVSTIEYISGQTASAEIINIDNPKYALVTYKKYMFTVDNNLNITNVQDDDSNLKPSGTINISEIGLGYKAEINLTNITKSGLNYDNCKYILNKSSNKIGTDILKYTDGNITSQNEVIKKYCEPGGPYYLHVLLTDNDGRKKEIISNEITIRENDSILGKISKISTSGMQNIVANEQTYPADVIVYDGNLVLDGTTQVTGATLSNKVYEFGDVSDCATASENATRMVVLKVNGDLTINSGVTLTACKNASGYGGPKGMTIFCTGTLTNNGTISMTARGAKAVGQNVYLWKNENNTYEFVPAVGGAGGVGQTVTGNTWHSDGRYYGDYINGNPGGNGEARGLGGGGARKSIRYRTPNM